MDGRQKMMQAGNLNRTVLCMLHTKGKTFAHPPQKEECIPQNKSCGMIDQQLMLSNGTLGPQQRGVYHLMQRNGGNVDAIHKNPARNQADLSVHTLRGLCNNNIGDVSWK
eukprot:scaffold183663_cov14-Tisochrysis_lutea.AAC.1